MTTSTIAINMQTQICKLYVGRCVWVTKCCSCEENPWKARLCIRGQSSLQADAVVALLRPTSRLVAFLVLKWQAHGACDEYSILLEENNFTDLTFGEKENSEQGPIVCIKQASYGSSFECASVIFQSHWLVLVEWDSNWKPVLIKIRFCERGVYFHMHTFALCVMLCSFKFPARSAQ